MVEDLGTSTPWGIIEPITSNSLPFCLRCSVKITKENDSKWQSFTEDGRTSQSVCKECYKKDNEESDKWVEKFNALCPEEKEKWHNRKEVNYNNTIDKK